MRLFLAVKLDAVTLKILNQKSKTFQQNFQNGKWVKAQSHHLTLQFLGENDQLPEICSAMKEGVRGIYPLKLALSGVEAWPRKKDATLIERVSDCEGEMFKLYQSMQTALETRGIVCQKRRLMPHITLCRALPLQDMQKLNEPDHVQHTFISQCIQLFQSEVCAGERIYTVLHEQII